MLKLRGQVGDRQLKRHWLNDTISSGERGCPGNMSAAKFDPCGTPPQRHFRDGLWADPFERANLISLIRDCNPRITHTLTSSCTAAVYYQTLILCTYFVGESKGETSIKSLLLARRAAPYAPPPPQRVSLIKP
ncbi:hypothetical protein J6590_066125 [Homalodisca vitripennis]|nr:hypothetical protein J6590_066125 [Homalodisca vitripennis]